MVRLTKEQLEKILVVESMGTYKYPEDSEKIANRGRPYKKYKCKISLDTPITEKEETINDIIGQTYFIIPFFQSLKLGPYGRLLLSCSTLEGTPLVPGPEGKFLYTSCNADFPDDSWDLGSEFSYISFRDFSLAGKYEAAPYNDTDKNQVTDMLFTGEVKEGPKKGWPTTCECTIEIPLLALSTLQIYVTGYNPEKNSITGFGNYPVAPNWGDTFFVEGDIFCTAGFYSLIADSYILQMQGNHRFLTTYGDNPLPLDAEAVKVDEIEPTGQDEISYFSRKWKKWLLSYEYGYEDYILCFNLPAHHWEYRGNYLSNAAIEHVGGWWPSKSVFIPTASYSQFLLTPYQYEVLVGRYKRLPVSVIVNRDQWNQFFSKDGLESDLCLEKSPVYCPPDPIGDWEVDLSQDYHYVNKWYYDADKFVEIGEYRKRIPGYIKVINQATEILGLLPGFGSTWL